MNKKELAEILRKENVPENTYSLDGGLPNDSMCLEKNAAGWEVYYSERGQKYHEKYFFTEEEACEYLYHRIKEIW